MGMVQPEPIEKAPAVAAPALAGAYGAALAAYVKSADEALLVRAYELGRLALSEGLSIPDLVALHGGAVKAIIRRADDLGSAIDLVDAAALFLGESLAPFEMTHRGYHEALIAVRHLNEILEAEVKRIAHALHDEAGELFVSTYLALAEVEQQVPQAVRQRLREVNGLLIQVESRLRGLSHELRPTMLDDLGWLPALQFLAEAVSRRAHLPITVSSTVDQRLAPRTETALYRTVQEALTNAVRHAKARNVTIEVKTLSDRLLCEVVDDGVGFDIDSKGPAGGLGLRGMRERLSAVGGRLDVRTAPGDGTRIRLELPVGC